MIKLNLLPQEGIFERERREKAERARKQRITQVLIAFCVLLIVLPTGFFIHQSVEAKKEEERAEQVRFEEARKQREQMALERQRTEAEKKRQDRADMLNALTGKNFTADQWDLLSEEERTALIRIASQ